MGFSRRIFALSLVWIALLLQAAAPIGAARMAAQMADPFAAMPICSPDGARTGAPSDQQDPVGRHDHNCCVCSVCAPLHAGPASAVAAGRNPSPTILSRPQFAVQASPRGPPLRAPNARGPPSRFQTA